MLSEGAEEHLVAILLLMFSVFLPIVMYRKGMEGWLTVIAVLLFIWSQVTLIMLLTPTAFYRYRSTFDPLIHLVMCIGILEIVRLVQAKIRQKKSETV